MPQRDAGELAGPFEAIEVVVVAVVALLDEAGVAAHAELLAEPREAARDAGVDLGQQVALALAGAQQAEAADQQAADASGGHRAARGPRRLAVAVAAHRRRRARAGLGRRAIAARSA
ncbi:MAG: hypothetical protein ACK501_02895 [Planctomycetota bacterium]